MSIFLGLNGRQPMRAMGEKATLLTRLWLFVHGFKRFKEEPDGGALWVNLNKGSYFAPRTAAELKAAALRQAEEQKKMAEEMAKQKAAADGRGEGPEQQGRIVMPGDAIPGRRTRDN